MKLRWLFFTLLSLIVLIYNAAFLDSLRIILENQLSPQHAMIWETSPPVAEGYFVQAEPLLLFPITGTLLSFHLVWDLALALIIVCSLALSVSVYKLVENKPSL